MITSLFSGIGGFEAGFRKAGLETILFCESDPGARAVLQDRFPGIPIRNDISTLASLPRVSTILTAGFPCQNLSMAGDKVGIRGGQSALVEEMFRLLAQRRVPTVIVENVYFMLHLKRGKGMERLVRGFESLGYSWAYRVVDTYWFGLPQRRRRVFLVASTVVDPRDVLLADEGQQGSFLKPSLKKPIGFYWTEGRSGVGTTSDAIPPLKGGSALGIPSAPAVLWPDGSVSVPSIVEAERIQGFPSHWTRAADTVSERMRWRLIGNAVSVPVAAWLGRRIGNPGRYDATDDLPLLRKAKWPNAAWGSKGTRKVSGASTKPVSRKTSSLEAFASDQWLPLSERAARGFLARARSSSLNFPDGFLRRIDAYIKSIAHP